MTRRDFLAGAAAAGAAGAAAAALPMAAGAEEAGASSGSGAAAASGDASGAASWLGDEPQVPADQIASTEEFDLVVCGAGPAGLITAAMSAELGLTAVVLESYTASSTFRSDIAGIDTPMQKDEGVVVDKAAAIHDIMRYTTGYSDLRLLKIWADESCDAVEWVRQMLEGYDIPMFLESDLGSPDMAFEDWPVGHGFSSTADATNALVDYVGSLGVEIRYETPMVRLVHEEGGPVTGVVAQNPDGDYIQVNARKGVLLATGGYATNDDMLKALVPGPLHQCVKKEVTPSQMGDGIKAALWAGAAMDEDGTIMSFERGLVPFGPEFDGPDPDSPIWWVGSQPFLRVTLKGERFSDESTPYDFSNYAIRNRHGNTWAQIFDANWEDQVAQFRTVGCSRIVDPGTMPGWTPSIPMAANEGMLASYVEGGLIQQADTIAELAEKCGMDPEVLQATVDRYNELVAKGVDEDFYKESSRLAPVDTPPFYAARLGGMLLATLNGLSVDADLQVVDRQGEPLGGLYANGNDCGGTYAHVYPSRFTGLHMGRTVSFAWHIAHHLAEK